MEEYDGCSDRMTPKGSVIFACSPADQAAVDLAKKFIQHHGLTAEDVKILKNDKTVSVEAKKDLILSLIVFDIVSQDQRGK